MPDGQSPDLVTLTIDGRQVSVPRGTLIVEAARQLAVEVPVFCYHHKMNPVGACRLCLVEVAPGPPKPQTACTTPVAEGMVVRTNSQMAVAARADILEFELVNHPLDCPVCDKGGECPLQDFTFRHGYPVSRTDTPRLHFQKPIPLSERIALDRERCVLCYRCTRYYDEIAWEQELTADHRGARSFITSQFEQPLRSLVSGNIIDLCPVGALTSRVWRFESRPWDMNHTDGVCARCAVGCNTSLWERRNQLVRVTSRENDDVDDGWICDRGRFEYTEVNQPARLLTPIVGGRPASWDVALATLAEGLRGGRVGIALPQDVTNEEAYLVSRLVAGPLRGARVALERRTSIPALDDTLPIRELEQARVIVVVATDTADEAPILNLRIKKAVSKRGARLVVVHPDRLDLDRWKAALHVGYPPGGAVAALAGLAGHEALAEGPVAIVFGDGAGTEEGAAVARAAAELAGSVGGRLLPVYRAGNERGVLALGLAAEPDDLAGCEAVLVWGGAPVPASATFVAAWDSLPRERHAGADVVLPAVTFAETQGTYTNLEGRVQFNRPALQVRRPGRERWDVLAEIGRRLGLDTDYPGIFPLQRELAAAVPALAAVADHPLPEAAPAPVLKNSARP